MILRDPLPLAPFNLLIDRICPLKSDDFRGGFRMIARGRRPNNGLSNQNKTPQISLEGFILKRMENTYFLLAVFFLAVFFFVAMMNLLS